MKTVPRLMMSCLAIAILLGVGFGTRSLIGSSDPTSGGEVAAKERRVSVITTPAEAMEFVRGVSVSGDVQAENYALVSARVPGTLEEVLVDEGDRVVKDETILFRTDSVTLERGVEVARHGLEVAGAAEREAVANLERLSVLENQARTDVERFRRLREKGAATVHQLELAETNHREASATLVHAHAVIDLARAQQSQAASRLAIAEKQLADSVVRAPIDGRVVERLREPGEMAGAGAPVLRIEDLEGLEISAFLPEECYAEVRPGETEVRARFGAFALEGLVVTYRGVTVHRTHRNFEMKAAVPTPPVGLVPGRLVDLTVVLEARQALGIPRSAILERRGRSIVFVVDGEHAREIEVRTGLTTDGWIEVVDGALTSGSPIVTEGQDWLEDGDLVNRVEAK